VTFSGDAQPEMPRAAADKALKTPLASQAPWIETPEPRWRKYTGSIIVGIGAVFAAATLLLYGYLLWTSPPDFGNGSSRQFRSELFL
jgi:hypothetical protein